MEEKVERLNASWLNGRYTFDSMVVEINTVYEWFSIILFEGDKETDNYFAQGEEAVAWMEDVIDIIELLPEISFREAVRIFARSF